MSGVLQGCCRGAPAILQGCHMDAAGTSAAGASDMNNNVGGVIAKSDSCWGVADS